MDWCTLIDTTRLGSEDSNKKDNRNSFDRDFDRILFSKEFRLLQAKTQVVPFPEYDATHTRLTHSLETSSVGRSLGTMVSERLSLEKKCMCKNEDIGAIVSAACLCHDIGNPPLGHSGEDAISQFFKDEKGSRILSEKLTKDQRYDFENFEGNAIGFHLLTHSDPVKTKLMGGLGLTYSTLAAFVKYPNRKGKSDENSDLAFTKKSGLLWSDVRTFKKVTDKLGIKGIGDNVWCRHPLAYLTEAADDICYAVIDLEDGYKNGSLSFECASELLINLIKQDKRTSIDHYNSILSNDEKMGYLRAKAINALIDLCVDAFVENNMAILDGTFKATLVKSITPEAKKVYGEITKIEVQSVYTHEKILLTEAAGFVVLPGLLDIFTSAAFEDSKRSNKIKECILKDLICEDEALPYEEKNYNTLLNIVTFVALMTDNHAVKLYRELTGTQLPNY